MFNVKEFSDILQKISNSYDSITEFANKSDVNRTFLSKCIKTYYNKLYSIGLTENNIRMIYLSFFYLNSKKNKGYCF